MVSINPPINWLLSNTIGNVFHSILIKFIIKSKNAALWSSRYSSQLIITNCIIMGRFEAYAMANKPWPSFLDGIGNGAGYAILLLIVAFVRELFGSGSLFGIKILGSAVPGEETGLYTMGYVNNNLIILPPMALIIVGIIIWVQRAKNTSLQEEN